MNTMTTATTPMPAPNGVTPIALGPGEGEALWFLGTLGTVKASADTTAGRVAVIEQLAPRGSGSPLHVHHSEDEWFYVIEGELTLWVGGRIITAPAGSFVFGPRDIPHTFMVSSDEARFLLVRPNPPALSSSCARPHSPQSDWRSRRRRRRRRTWRRWSRLRPSTELRFSVLPGFPPDPAGDGTAKLAVSLRPWETASHWPGVTSRRTPLPRPQAARPCSPVR